jgi:hypothetical protein
MMTLVGPVLVLSGFGLYMLSNTLLGRFRRIPWEFLAVSALGLVVALAIMLRDGGTANIIAAVASAVLSGFLLDEPASSAGYTAPTPIGCAPRSTRSSPPSTRSRPPDGRRGTATLPAWPIPPYKATPSGRSIARKTGSA